jgi:hypothetical protein
MVEKTNKIIMTREDAKKWFRTDIDSYGKPKSIMNKINKIYDDMEKHPQVSDCPLCGKSDNTIHTDNSRGSSQGQSDIGTTKGQTNHYFFCKTCNCIFDVTVKYQVVNREEYMKTMNGNTGIRG